jgi:V8-like Glu-specific endopeptidase
MADPGDWQEIYTLSPNLRKLASGVVAVFLSEYLMPLDQEAVSIPLDPQDPESIKRLRDWANGTGFLVGESLLATAGHVLGIHGKEIFGKHFLLGYQTNSAGEINTRFPTSLALTAERLVDSRNFTDIDWGLITLNRPAPASAQILRINEEDKLEPETPVFIIGHPQGLPAKYTGQGLVTEVEEQIFTINLPISLHHSGSPVFNARTRKVEGILFNEDANCYKVCFLAEVIRNNQR